MEKEVRIRLGERELVGELSEEKNPQTAQAIWKALPFESQIKLWGKEIYFSIPVELGLENPQGTVNQGELAYWPPGKAFCIFLGLTPASDFRNIKPASPVNVFGRIIKNKADSVEKILEKLKEGDKVRVEKK